MYVTESKDITQGKKTKTLWRNTRSETIRQSTEADMNLSALEIQTEVNSPKLLKK